MPRDDFVAGKTRRFSAYCTRKGCEQQVQKMMLDNGDITKLKVDATVNAANKISCFGTKVFQTYKEELEKRGKNNE